MRGTMRSHSASILRLVSQGPSQPQSGSLLLSRPLPKTACGDTQGVGVVGLVVVLVAVVKGLVIVHLDHRGSRSRRSPTVGTKPSKGTADGQGASTGSVARELGRGEATP